MVPPLSAFPLPLFDRMAYIGIGLINSSVARVVQRDKLAAATVACARSAANRAAALHLGLVDVVTADVTEAVAGADLVMLGTPVSAYGALARVMAPHLRPGAIITDVGSVKEAVIRNVTPHLPAHVHFVPGHPIAGTEHSGPEAGLAELFMGRWTILTPLAGTNPTAVGRVRALWEACGARVDLMDPAHHDRVLAITSHLPHLIAYTIVGTATDLEEHMQHEVIKYSASGFRDFTRIAASDPVMWRDIFLNNREAVLDSLQRFTEDLTALQRAIRWGEGSKLEDLFTRTQAIRRSIIEARQA
ncbi:Cyclohexadienyl dehydrogenase [invertebrate metagenome]|uniref:Cyclohexadienyl dehydrogenase n=1 Tax=invertebrate metagenome TaxID=1711999 RepID=A0A484H7G7_9ZZZZ